MKMDLTNTYNTCSKITVEVHQFNLRDYTKFSIPSSAIRFAFDNNDGDDDWKKDVTVGQLGAQRLKSSTAATHLTLSLLLSHTISRNTCPECVRKWSLKTDQNYTVVTSLCSHEKKIEVGPVYRNYYIPIIVIIFSTPLYLRCVYQNK